VKRLAAFFYYYGAKNSLARRYPAPEYDAIIEPFAGSAAYALAYPDRRVHLIDLDPRVAGAWDYLIRAPERDVLALPDLPREARVDDLPVCQEAKWLIGLCLGIASSYGAQPKWSPMAWGMTQRMRGGRPDEASLRMVWSPQCRQKIASQQRFIRHWTVSHGSWESAPVTLATYFVDPPYEVAGKHYVRGSSRIDFSALAAWCRASPGQVIACEAEGATWLPFRLLDEIASQGRGGVTKGKGRSREVVWTNRALTRGRQMQWLDVLAGTPDNDNDRKEETA
jgi:hypothetical protein